MDIRTFYIKDVVQENGTWELYSSITVLVKKHQPKEC